jgi:histidyl-tRNA synthetase
MSRKRFLCAYEKLGTMNVPMDTPQTLKGFRDFLPKDMAIRNKAISILTNVFERYGFEPLITPTLEYAEVLMGKYGEEADKLLYLFEDRGGRKVGLNYDLTVPLARILAQYRDIPQPFKRYQIQSSYRAENTQKGRFRQFTQCDVDIVGSKSPLSDAEILAVIYDSLTELGFKSFAININSRAILKQLMDSAQIPEDKRATILQSVDKLGKISPEAIDDELEKKGLSTGLFTKTIAPKLNSISSEWGSKRTTGDTYLDEVIKLAESLGVSKYAMKFNPSVVRGLDYYTGPIFETVVMEPAIGSITGGGRFDNLIKLLGGPDEPAVGTTIGLDRICTVIEDLNMWPDVLRTSARVLVTIFSKDLTKNAVGIAKQLRDSRINTQLYPDESAKLEKQLKYADAKGIPFVVIQGPEEDAKGIVQLKNMKTKEQKEVKITDIIDHLN